MSKWIKIIVISFVIILAIVVVVPAVAAWFFTPVNLEVTEMTQSDVLISN
ncbi:hypothetical protein FACS189499_00960 [Clostridia bacterium]|nr:hypothetical protein FACS189499_00960 [Clostridia bacterium]